MSARVSQWTFAAKKTCPVCSASFDAEKLMAKKLSASSWDLTLRNIYNVDVENRDPLIYMIATCPACLYTAFEGDFGYEDARKNPDIDEAVLLSKSVLESLGIRQSEFKGPRDLRTGLAGYYLAEIWYGFRNNLPIKLFRRAITFYRRMWLLKPAFEAGFITRDHYENDRIYSLQMADNNFEQSYLSERLPDNLFYGPDYGVNFGPASMPYLVASINYTLSLETSEPAAARIACHKKSIKFLSLAQSALARDGLQELRNKAVDLKERIREAEKHIPSSVAPGEAAPANAASKTHGQDQREQDHPAASGSSRAGAKTAADGSEFLPEIEVIEWDMYFESLMGKYGRSYAAGENIIEEGDETNDLFLIVDGRANVVKTYLHDKNVVRKLIAVLGKGAFFGEMSLLDSSPRSATVIASEPTRVIRISPTNLEMMIQNYPALAIKMMTVLAKRIRNYDAFVQHQLLPMMMQCGAKGGVGESKIDVRNNLRVELEGLMQEVRDRAYS